LIRSNKDETQFKGLEEKRAATLEVAKKEDAPKEESSEGRQVMIISGFMDNIWEYGVTRQHRGLQLQV